MSGRYDPRRINKHQNVTEKAKDVYRGYWIIVAIIIVVAVLSLI